MTRRISMVDEQRLFSLLPDFFEKPQNVITELIQNACRSGATVVDIILKGNDLQITDNGIGTPNLEPLFVLAESQWSPDAEEQRPAGFGLFYLYAISETVYFKSIFGSITVDCRRYLEDADYRGSILSEVRDFDRTDRGFNIKATLKEEVCKGKFIEEDKLSYFPLRITINGEHLERKDPAEQYSKFKIKTTYYGNNVWISPESFTSKSWLSNHLKTIWYGMPITKNNLNDYWVKVVIDVKEGSPLTPVLPYRTAVKEDEKLEQFWQFLRKTVVDYCTDVINSFQPGANDGTVDYSVLSLMKVMGNIATQEELNLLNYYYVHSDEPHYSTETESSSESKEVIVTRGDRLVSDHVVEIIKFTSRTSHNFEDLSSAIEDNNLVLRQGVIVEITENSNAPDWLKIERRPLTIEIQAYESESVTENYTWQKCGVRCGDKEVDLMAIVEYSCNGEIFYSKDVEDFWDIGEAVFAQCIWGSDGDTYETQYEYFNSDIDHDIKTLTGVYNISDLLKGLNEIGISPHDVREIKVTRKSIIITTTDKSKKTFKHQR